MTAVTKAAIVLALTIITTTSVFAASRKPARVQPATLSAAVVGSRAVLGLPFAVTPEEEARFDHAKGYPSGY